MVFSVAYSTAFIVAHCLFVARTHTHLHMRWYTHTHTLARTQFPFLFHQHTRALTHSRTLAEPVSTCSCHVGQLGWGLVVTMQVVVVWSKYLIWHWTSWGATSKKLRSSNFKTKNRSISSFIQITSVEQSSENLGIWSFSWKKILIALKRRLKPTTVRFFPILIFDKSLLN